jgi:SseB protein N-terminal domain
VTTPDDSTTTSQTAHTTQDDAPQDAGDEALLLRALANSVALIPQPPAAEGQEPPEGAIALPVIEQDGQRFVPVFTSEESLREAGADPGTAVLIPVAELAAHWPEEDVWLAVNPASEEGLGLPPDVVRALPVFAGQSADGDGSP